jgi:hypothetical protein
MEKLVILMSLNNKALNMKNTFFIFFFINFASNSYASSSLKYLGGAILDKVELVSIDFKNNGSQEIKKSLMPFYPALVKSSYYDILEQYHTRRVSIYNQKGTNQNFRKGSYLGNYTINIKNQKTITSKSIETILEQNIIENKLPQNSNQRLYLFYISNELKVSDSSGVNICGVHGYFSSKKIGNVVYAIVTNKKECQDKNETELNSITHTISHEFFESITDPLIRFYNGKFDYEKSAWISGKKDNDYEIADNCDDSIPLLLHTQTESFKVSAIWSNQIKGCDYQDSMSR